MNLRALRCAVGCYVLPMGGQVSVWVPIVVAALGFVGVLGAQLIAAWREDRRWRRDSARQDENRLYTARSDAYAHLIGRIEYWDVALFPLVRGKDNPPASGALERSEAAYDAANTGQGMVNLFAPEHIRVWILETIRPRLDMTRWITREGEPDREKLTAAWRDAQIAYRTLRALMRADLGMDAGQDFLDHANIKTPQHITPWENPEPDPPDGSA
ncbi:hypothetical protein [Nocardia niigatensis]